MEGFTGGCNFFHEYLVFEVAVNGQRKKLKAGSGFPVAIKQIYMDYHLPISPRDITMEEVHFFYDALIPGLIEIQQHKKEMKNGKQVRR